MPAEASVVGGSASLAAAAGRAAAALQTIARSQPQAREHLAGTAAAARQALDDVREVTASYRDAARPEAVPAQAGVTLAPRLAQAVLVTVLQFRRRHVLKLISGAAVAAPLAAGLLGTVPARAAQRQTVATADDLQALLAAEIAAGMPGSVAEVREGDKTYQLAAGVADVSAKLAPWSGSHHRIGGATKSFTAVAVLLLAGERLIDLDAPISRYFLGVVPGDLGRQITVRMLLNHTSGIADFAVTAYPASNPNKAILFTTPQSIADTATRTYQPQDLIRLGLSLPRTGAPGAAWSYASTNYAILGLLIERMTGRTYEEEVTRRVLQPAGLRNSYLPGRARGIAGPRMAAYVPWSGSGYRNFTSYDMSWGWASRAPARSVL